MNEELRVHDLATNLHEYGALPKCDLASGRDYGGFTNWCFSSEDHVARFRHCALCPGLIRLSIRRVRARPIDFSTLHRGGTKDPIVAVFDVRGSLMLAVHQLAKNVPQLAARSINVPDCLGRDSGFPLVEELDEAALRGDGILDAGLRVVKVLHDCGLLICRRQVHLDVAHTRNAEVPLSDPHPVGRRAELRDVRLAAEQILAITRFGEVGFKDEVRRAHDAGHGRKPKRALPGFHFVDDKIAGPSNLVVAEVIGDSVVVRIVVRANEDATFTRYREQR